MQHTIKPKRKRIKQLLPRLKPSKMQPKLNKPDMKLEKLLKEAKRKEKQREKDLFGGKLRRRTVKVGVGDPHAHSEATGQDETSVSDESPGASAAACKTAQTGLGTGEDDGSSDNIAADAVVSTGLWWS